jgi:hypothetical protein
LTSLCDAKSSHAPARPDPAATWRRIRVDDRRGTSSHSCRTDVLDGSVRHDPEPLEPPPAGSALLCCARPEGDVVLDA